MQETIEDIIKRDGYIQHYLNDINFKFSEHHMNLLFKYSSINNLKLIIDKYPFLIHRCNKEEFSRKIYFLNNDELNEKWKEYKEPDFSFHSEDIRLIVKNMEYFFQLVIKIKS